MAALGERLRRERERRGETLEDVAKATRISLRMLAALERGRYAELPGRVYGKSFVAAYARHLQLDPAPLVAAYVAEEESLARAGQLGEPPDLLDELRRAVAHREENRPERLRRRLRVVVPAAGLLLLLVAAGWWFRGGGSPGRPAVGRPAPLRAPEAAVAPEAGGGPGEEPAAEEAGAAEAALPAAPPPQVAGRAEAAPARPAPTPAAAEASPTTEAARLSIPDFGVGTAVVDRQLQGRADRFPPGATVYFWTRVLGGRRGDVVRHVWLHEGRRVGVAPLPVNGPHWRTYSRRVLPADCAGAWTVEARDAEGRVLAQSSFTCAPEPGDG